MQQSDKKTQTIQKKRKRKVKKRIDCNHHKNCNNLIKNTQTIQKKREIKVKKITIIKIITITTTKTMLPYLYCYAHSIGCKFMFSFSFLTDALPIYFTPSSTVELSSGMILAVLDADAFVEYSSFCTCCCTCSRK